MKTIKNPLFWISGIFGAGFCCFAIIIAVSSSASIQQSVLLVGGIASIVQAMVKVLLRNVNYSEYWFMAIFIVTVVIAFVFIGEPWMRLIMDLSNRGVFFLVGIGLQFFDWADIIEGRGAKAVREDTNSDIKELQKRKSKLTENVDKLEQTQNNLMKNIASTSKKTKGLK